MRAAIVGAGGIARVHARLIRELGGTLVGVCGRTLASAQAAHFAGAPAYDNVAALLREQKPDVVHVWLAEPSARGAHDRPLRRGRARAVRKAAGD